MMSPSWRSKSGTSPPSGVNESCIALTEPFDAAVVVVAQRAEEEIPKRTSLPSMLPPEWSALPSWSTGRPQSPGLPLLLLRDAHREQRQNDDEHRPEKDPALPRVLHHLAERVANGTRDRQNRQQLDEVRESRRVLERGRRVYVEEPASVRPQLLDRNLRAGRADRANLIDDGLSVRPLHRLKKRHCVVRAEGLHDAL